MPRFNKQQSLPPLQLKEALASLGVLWADAEVTPFLTDEERATHRSNVVEFLVAEGAMTQEKASEILAPF